MTRTLHRFVFAAAALGLVLSALTRPAVAADGSGYSKLLQEKSAAIVTIKYVLKLKMGGMGNQENETEITGFVIDPKGVVLCSNSQLDGFASLMRMMGRDLTATPTELKILIGDDTEGLEAELISHDTELDLAWLKLKEPPPKPLAHIDLNQGVAVQTGQEIVSVRRLDSFFGRSAIVSTGRIAGKTDSPRDLLIPDGGTAGALGLPVFTLDGKVIGVAVLQTPDEEDVEANPTLMRSRMSSMQDMMAGFILPSAAVVKATKQALANQTEGD